MGTTAGVVARRPGAVAGGRPRSGGGRRVDRAHLPGPVRRVVLATETNVSDGQATDLEARAATHAQGFSTDPSSKQSGRHRATFPHDLEELGVVAPEASQTKPEGAERDQPACDNEAGQRHCDLHPLSSRPLTLAPTDSVVTSRKWPSEGPSARRAPEDPAMRATPGRRRGCGRLRPGSRPRTSARPPRPGPGRPWSRPPPPWLAPRSRRCVP